MGMRRRKIIKLSRLPSIIKSIPFQIGWARRAVSLSLMTFGPLDLDRFCKVRSYGVHVDARFIGYGPTGPTLDGCACHLHVAKEYRKLWMCPIHHHRIILHLLSLTFSFLESLFILFFFFSFYLVIVRNTLKIKENMGPHLQILKNFNPHGCQSSKLARNCDCNAPSVPNVASRVEILFLMNTRVEIL